MIASVTFTHEFITGVDMIDRQHEEMFEHINSLLSASGPERLKHEVEDTLEFLKQYVLRHFEDEEKIMLECGYPDYDWHRNWHWSYIAKLDDLSAEFRENGISDNYVHILDNFLVGWIVKHIETVDMKLGDYIHKHTSLTRRYPASSL